MPVVHLCRTEHLVMGHLGPLMLQVWTSQPSLTALYAMEREEDKLLLKYPRLCSLTLVHSGKQVSSEVRQKSADMLKKYDPYLTAMVILIEGSGLTAMIASGFMATMGLLYSYKTPMRCFRKLDDAARWVYEVPGQVPEITSMVTLREESRRFFELATGRQINA